MRGWNNCGWHLLKNAKHRSKGDRPGARGEATARPRRMGERNAELQLLPKVSAFHVFFYLPGAKACSLILSSNLSQGARSILISRSVAATTVTLMTTTPATATTCKRRLAARFAVASAGSDAGTSFIEARLATIQKSTSISAHEGSRTLHGFITQSAPQTFDH